MVQSDAKSFGDFIEALTPLHRAFCNTACITRTKIFSVSPAKQCGRAPYAISSILKLRVQRCANGIAFV
jgi:methionyl-tRNA formyltransferase